MVKNNDIEKKQLSTILNNPPPNLDEYSKMEESETPLTSIIGDIQISSKSKMESTLPTPPIKA